MRVVGNQNILIAFEGGIWEPTRLIRVEFLVKIVLKIVSLYKQGPFTRWAVQALCPARGLVVWSTVGQTLLCVRALSKFRQILESTWLPSFCLGPATTCSGDS